MHTIKEFMTEKHVVEALLRLHPLKGNGRVNVPLLKSIYIIQKTIKYVFINLVLRT